MAADPQTELHAWVDAKLAAWRQGDCLLGDHWFVLRFDPAHPLSEPAREAAASEGVDLAEAWVRGFMVATQTCDLVRSCAARPFVELCPLVEVDPERLQEIRTGKRPGYAYLPLLSDRRLVADLDRTMTVEKPVIAACDRTPGCETDADIRRLSSALGRKRERFAFPDDFVSSVRSLQGRLVEKHSRDSDEGRALRSLREIRVRAAPAWDAPQVELFFWFIREEASASFDGQSWSTLSEKWLDRVAAEGRFQSVSGAVVTLQDLTAADYVESDPLDLDHLSSAG